MFHETRFQLVFDMLHQANSNMCYYVPFSLSQLPLGNDRSELHITLITSSVGSIDPEKL